MSATIALLRLNHVHTYFEFVFYFILANYNLKHNPVTHSGFINTLNLIWNLYLVFIWFSVRYRTISSANEAESISEETELNSHYSVTTNWNKGKTKHCSLPTIPATPSSFIFFLGNTSKFAPAWEFTVLTQLSRAHVTRGEKVTTPDTAFTHCCYPTGKQQSNLLNKHNGQCTFTVTLRHVRVTFVTVKKEVLYILRLCL